MNCNGCIDRNGGNDWAWGGGAILRYFSAAFVLSL